MTTVPVTGWRVDDIDIRWHPVKNIPEIENKKISLVDKSMQAISQKLKQNAMHACADYQNIVDAVTALSLQFEDLESRSRETQRIIDETRILIERSKYKVKKFEKDNWFLLTVSENITLVFNKTKAFVVDMKTKAVAAVFFFTKVHNIFEGYVSDATFRKMLRASEFLMVAAIVSVPTAITSVHIYTRWIK